MESSSKAVDYDEAYYQQNSQACSLSSETPITMIDGDIAKELSATPNTARRFC